MSIPVYAIPPHLKGDTWDGIYNIKFEKGGVPINLSGAKVSMDFRQELGARVANLTLSTLTSTISVTNPEGGEIRIFPVIADMPASKYVYDLEVTFPDGVVKTYLKGTWQILQDITE